MKNLQASAICGIVLAGGKSSRMGQDKALLPYGDKRLVEHALAILEQKCQTLLVSSNKEIEGLTYPCIPDVYAGLGPLAGLQATLSASGRKHHLVLPCDVPFIPASLLERLLPTNPHIQAVIPVHPNGKQEPLVAYYSHSALALIEDQLQQGDLKMMHLLARLRVQTVPLRDTEAAWFQNVNTLEDYQGLKAGNSHQQTEQNDQQISK